MNISAQDAASGCTSNADGTEQQLMSESSKRMRDDSPSHENRSRNSGAQKPDLEEVAGEGHHSSSDEVPDSRQDVQPSKRPRLRNHDSDETESVDLEAATREVGDRHTAHPTRGLIAERIPPSDENAAEADEEVVARAITTQPVVLVPDSDIEASKTDEEASGTDEEASGTDEEVPGTEEEGLESEDEVLATDEDELIQVIARVRRQARGANVRPREEEVLPTYDGPGEVNHGLVIGRRQIRPRRPATSGSDSDEESSEAEVQPADEEPGEVNHEMERARGEVRPRSPATSGIDADVESSEEEVLPSDDSSGDIIFGITRRYRPSIPVAAHIRAEPREDEVLPTDVDSSELNRRYVRPRRQARTRNAAEAPRVDSAREPNDDEVLPTDDDRAGRLPFWAGRDPIGREMPTQESEPTSELPATQRSSCNGGRTPSRASSPNRSQ